MFNKVDGSCAWGDCTRHATYRVQGILTQNLCNKHTVNTLFIDTHKTGEKVAITRISERVSLHVESVLIDAD